MGDSKVETDSETFPTPTNLLRRNLDNRDEGEKGRPAEHAVHRGHIEALVAARRKLEACGYDVVAGYISPSHSDYVSCKLGSSDTIGIEHRIRMAELALQEGDPLNFLAVDQWECQNRFVDFPHVRKHLENYLTELFPGEGIVVFYVCGLDHFLRVCITCVHCHSESLSRSGRICGESGEGKEAGCRLYHWNRCVAVTRPGYQIDPQTVSSIRSDAEVFLAETPMDSDVSSTQIRQRLREGRGIADLTFVSVAAYANAHMESLFEERS